MKAEIKVGFHRLTLFFTFLDIVTKMAMSSLLSFKSQLRSSVLMLQSSCNSSNQRHVVWGGQAFLIVVIGRFVRLFTFLPQRGACPAHSDLCACYHNVEDGKKGKQDA